MSPLKVFGLRVNLHIILAKTCVKYTSGTVGLELTIWSSGISYCFYGWFSGGILNHYSYCAKKFVKLHYMLGVCVDTVLSSLSCIHFCACVSVRLLLLLRIDSPFFIRLTAYMFWNGKIKAVFTFKILNAWNRSVLLAIQWLKYFFCW